jgi:hypothetical protein
MEHVKQTEKPKDDKPQKPKNWKATHTAGEAQRGTQTDSKVIS